MNNLKFRVWDKANKEMLKIEVLDFFFKEIRVLKNNGSRFSTKFEDVELMQSTGLKDKNGVEIFEGDIVVGKFYFAGVGYFDTGEREVIVRNKPVLWEDGKFLCSGFDLSEMNECIKVIGNIYKNKELLRK